MLWIYYPILFIFGLGIGSFLNVVIWRYKPGRSVFDIKPLKGRSHCPYCRKKLKWFELIPLISFFAQGGRCRSCKHKLSAQYPIVEFLSGAIFVGVPYFLINFYNLENTLADKTLLFILFALWVLVFLTWLLVSVIDWRHYLIPNGLNVMLATLGLFIVVIKNQIAISITPFHGSFLRHYTLIFSPTQDIWINHIIGALVGALFFVLIILISRGRAMGWGDVKFALASGFVIAWPEVALSLILAFVLGGLFGAVLLITNKKTMKDKLPFAPFLTVSMAITIFFGYYLIQNYLGLFGM